MPPTFIYILALMGYFAVACSVWFVALVLAIPQGTRALAKRLAAGMAGSFPGVFLFQILATPLVALVPLFVAGIFWIFHPTDAGAAVLILLMTLLLLMIVAAASLLGFCTGWRAGWELASGRSPRAFLRGDRFVGPAVRFLRRRLPFLERIL